MKLLILTTPTGLEQTNVIRQMNKLACENRVDIRYEVISDPNRDFVLVDRGEFTYRLDPLYTFKDMIFPKEIPQVTQGELVGRAIKNVMEHKHLKSASVAFINAIDGLNNSIITGMSFCDNTYHIYPEVPEGIEIFATDIVVNFGASSPPVTKFPKAMLGYITFSEHDAKHIPSGTATILNNNLESIATKLLFEKIMIFGDEIKTM